MHYEDRLRSTWQFEIKCLTINATHKTEKANFYSRMALMETKIQQRHKMTEYRHICSRFIASWHLALDFGSPGRQFCELLLSIGVRRHHRRLPSVGIFKLLFH